MSQHKHRVSQRLHQALNGIFFPPAEGPPAPSLPDQPEGAATEVVPITNSLWLLFAEAARSSGTPGIQAAAASQEQKGRQMRSPAAAAGTVSAAAAAL